MDFHKIIKRVRQYWKRIAAFVRYRNQPMPFVEAGTPTVAVLSKKEAEGFSRQGFQIAYMAEAKSSDDVSNAVFVACGMSMTGKANLLTDDELIIVNNSSHVIGKKFRKMEVALEEKADGTPVVVIITSTKELPPYMIKHVVREDFPEEEEQDVTPADEEAEAGDHRLLREPLADHMIIEAITTAANAMLNDGVAARMKWKEGGEYFDKEYGITHLAVCLFYFIHIHRLCTSSTFFFHQQKQYIEFCRDGLPKDANLCAERYFRVCISKLQRTSCSFDEYIKSSVKPEIVWEKGQFNLSFWYAVYRQAARHFSQVLTPEGQH